MLALALLPAAVAATVLVAPGEDWCGPANAAAPGDEIVLQAGEHAGPCDLRAPGAEGAPIVVRGADPDDRPHIVYDGAGDNVIDVEADWLTVRDLALGPSLADIDGVKVKQGSHVTVEGVLFDRIGGIGVGANSADSTGIAVRGCTFLDLASTAIYLGCHDGSCTAQDVVVEGNLIDGTSAGDGVGYGLEIKRDSWGAVRDNVIHDTQGPGIEIFGSEDPARASTVVGNFVLRSRVNASIEIGGPNAVVVDNLVVGGADGGIYVYPYWESVHGVVLAGNTVIGEARTAFRIAAEATLTRLTGNAGYQADGSGAFPATGWDGAGNVECATPGECWEDAAAFDFGPVAGGPLDGAGMDDPLLAVDFCGVSRGSPPDAGALETGGPGPLAIALKSTFACPEEGEDSAGDSGAVRDRCGCAAGRLRAGVAALLLAAGALALRRR